jgi:hypothetical protein
VPDLVGVAELEGPVRQLFKARSIRRIEAESSVAVNVIGEGGIRVVAQADHLHTPLDEADGRLTAIYGFR